MMSAIKAEFLKLFTVRSTYFIMLISLGLVALVAGYGNGYRIDAGRIHNPGILANESANSIIFVGVILAIAGLLLLAHEYRYNTILYTMTSSNSRAKSLLAKVVVVTVFATAMSVVVALFTPLCTLLGAHLAGQHLVAQNYPIWRVVWECGFVGWGYAMYALILTAIIRSQVGSIVTFLLVPLIGENIIRAIIKSSTNYLPFTNLQAVINTLLLQGDGSPISVTHGLVVAGVYIVGGLAVCLVLFAKRDAT